MLVPTLRDRISGVVLIPSVEQLRSAGSKGSEKEKQERLALWEEVKIKSAYPALSGLLL